MKQLVYLHKLTRKFLNYVFELEQKRDEASDCDEFWRNLFLLFSSFNNQLFIQGTRLCRQTAQSQTAETLSTKQWVVNGNEMQVLVSGKRSAARVLQQSLKRSSPTVLRLLARYRRFQSHQQQAVKSLARKNGTQVLKLVSSSRCSTRRSIRLLLRVSGMQRVVLGSLVCF